MIITRIQQGPAGPTGATGAAGSDAEVTAANMAAAGVAQAMRYGLESRTPKLHIAFVDDDSPAQTYSVLYPILSNDADAITALGLTPGTYDAVPGTAAVITGTSGSAFGGALTVAQALEMEAAGWEIASHSTVAGNLTSVSLAEAETRISASYDRLVALGFSTPQTFVWPNGGNNADLRAICSKYFRSARGVGSHIVNCRNIAPFSQYDFAGYPLGAYFGTDGSNTIDSLAEYKAIIDRALTHDRGEFVCFMLHSGDANFNATQRQALIDLLEYIQGLAGYSSGDIVFGTVAQVMDAMETVAGGGASSGTVDTPRIGRRDINPETGSGTWGVSRSGDFYFPNAGNLYVKAQNTVTPATELTSANFEPFKVTMATVLNDGEDWPERDDGTLLTYFPDLDANFGWQEYRPYARTYSFVRYWNSSAWTAWKIRHPDIGIQRVASVSQSLDFGSIAAQSSATLDVTIAGVTVGTTGTVPGDTVIATPARQPTDGLIPTCWVYDTNTVRLRLHNYTASPIDPGARTWRFDVLRNLSLGADH